MPSFGDKRVLISRGLGFEVVESRDGTHNTSEGEVMLSAAINNRSGTSKEDSVCFQSTEKLRPWSN